MLETVPKCCADMGTVWTVWRAMKGGSLCATVCSAWVSCATGVLATAFCGAGGGGVVGAFVGES